MASTSRIPVPSRISASSSMPIITTTSAVSSRSGSSLTQHLNIAQKSNIMTESDSDDQVWGKIEKLRTRRIYSEGNSDFAESPPSSAGVSTVGESPALGAVTLKPVHHGSRRAFKSTTESFGSNANGATSRQASSNLAGTAQPGITGPGSSPARPAHIAIPPRNPSSIIIGPSSPNQRNQTLKTRPVAARMSSLTIKPSSHQPGLGRSPNSDSNLSQSLYHLGTAEPNSQVQTESHHARPKLNSTISQGERGMQALGFRAAGKKDTFAGHLSVNSQLSRTEATNDRKASTTTSALSVSSTGADGGVPKRLRHVLGTESDRELARARAKGEISPSESDARIALRRKAIDIPSVLPSSYDMVTSAPMNNSARTEAYVHAVARNPPDIPITPDTDQSESDQSSHRLHPPNTTMTTAEKRHQPNLRLSAMPNVPFLLAPAIHHSARSPLSAVSPPIPAKNPLRQRSSFGGASPSRASTPGLSGIPSPNSLYITPAETSGPGILDRAPLLSPTRSHQLVSMPISPNSRRREGKSPRSTQLSLSPSSHTRTSPRVQKRPGESSPSTKDSRLDRNKALTTADIVKAMEYAEGPLQQQQSIVSGISATPPLKRLPDTPTDQSPATSTLSAGVSRLEDIRDTFPNPASALRLPMPKSDSSDNVMSKPSKSPSCPSLKVSQVSQRHERNNREKSSTIDILPPTSSHNQSALAVSPRPNVLHARSHSNPSSPAPVSPGFGGSSASGPTRMSKRAHLIQEIWETERMYANDLALVRDAFLYRLRPASQLSTSSAGATKTGGMSPDSRHSAFTFETAGTNATSFDSAVRASNEDDEKSPSSSSTILLARSPVALRMPSSTSLNQNLISLTNGKRKDVASSSDRRKPTEIMSTADVKAVFLNLEQLAAFSDALATSFENAIGDGSGQEPIITENVLTDEIVVDRLGAVFENVIPQIRSLYTFYCSRQGQANTRLSEIMSDPAQAAPLRECWETIQPFTHSWDLGSMLIKPVQRIMKYPMLFNELMALSTPAHPDYFSLKQAASSASAVADEINEVKRRKDLVEQAIHNGNGKKPLAISPTNTTNTVNKENKLSFKLAKRFGKNKDKDREKTSPVVGSLSHLNISPSTDAELKSLIKQLESNDMCIIRIGEEVEHFPDVMRQYWFSQLAVAAAWHEVYTLDSSDLIDRRMQVYRNMAELILKYPWVNLNKDIKYKVMPVMDILLNISRNPKTVITRLAGKKVDYTKVLNARQRNDLRNIDSETMQNAEDYVSLHAQLNEELPPFLEGMDKLMNILIGAFAIAQKDYYNGMQAHIRKFFFTVKLPVWGSGNAEGAKRPQTGPESVPGGDTIVRLWHDAWKPEQEALESLKLISALRNHALGIRAKSREQMNKPSEPFFRIPSHRATTPQMGGFVRTMSRTLLQPQLSRESSVASNLSRANRTRSSSLLGPAINDDSPHSSGSGASSASLARPLVKHSRAQSTSSVHLSASGAFGARVPSQSHVPSPPVPPRPDVNALGSRFSSTGTESDRNRPLSYLPSLNRTESIRLPGMQENSVPPPPQYKSRDGKTDASIPAVANWSDVRPLYQCVCVAGFQIFDRIHYSGLPFLLLAEGDIIDILYEVGRVDDLKNIPIDVGVADDGLLVARDVRKRIGLILCSFLEPLTQP